MTPTIAWTKTGTASGIVMVTVLLILVGDLLFYGLALGINLAVFTAFLAIGMGWASKFENWHWSTIILACASIGALAENISWISLTLALAGVATLAVKLEVSWYRDALGWVYNVFRFLLTGPARVFKDIKLFRKLRMRASKTILPGGVVTWIVPVVLTTVFALLFAAANPVMEDLFASLIQIPDDNFLPTGRILLWLVTLFAIWPFFARKLKNKKDAFIKAPEATDDKQTLAARLLSPQSIIRSLTMFNLLFALQTVLDIKYLWAGAQLPVGMTYASYAHRGAYPLIATAFLAAIFVLVTMHKGARSEHSKLVRGLVFVWIGQNILLTISSIERLRLYVEIYSQTYLRVAAFIWMGLVALGLALIIYRLWRNLPNRWLVNANLLSLVAVLLVSSFINFGSYIAWFNVQNSREITGKGQYLDLHYFKNIGPQSLPALIWLQTRQFNSHSALNRTIMQQKLKLRARRSNGLLVTKDWREQTLRDYRLAYWLAQHEAKGQKKIKPLISWNNHEQKNSNR